MRARSSEESDAMSGWATSRCAARQREEHARKAVCAEGHKSHRRRGSAEHPQLVRLETLALLTGREQRNTHQPVVRGSRPLTRANVDAPKRRCRVNLRSEDETWPKLAIPGWEATCRTMHM